MKCPRCGAEIPDSSSFCSVCGCQLNLNNPAHEIAQYGGSYLNQQTGKSGVSYQAQNMKPEKLFMQSFVWSIILLGIALGVFIAVMVVRNGPINSDNAVLMTMMPVASGVFVLLLSLLIVLQYEVKYIKSSNKHGLFGYVPFITFGITIIFMILSIIFGTVAFAQYI